MIESLLIQNYLLVDRIELDFSPGFTVLTGETGAGKSILMGALRVLAGERVSADRIRSIEEDSIIVGVWNIKNNAAALRFLEERGLPNDADRVIIRRILKSNGKSSAFIQSQQVTLRDLELFAGFMVDQHSQHEHQSLFSSQTQRSLLDAYARCTSDVERAGETFRECRTLEQQLMTFRDQVATLEEEKDYLSHAITEITAAKLEENEEELLEQELSALTHSEEIQELSAKLLELFDRENGIESGIKQALRILQLFAGKTHAFDQSNERLTALHIELRDIHSDITGQTSSLVFDPSRLNEVEKRLRVIDLLKSKYGKSTKEIQTFLVNAEKKLARLHNSETKNNELEQRLKEHEQALITLSKNISLRRTEVSEKLTKEITKRLWDLGMPHASLIVQTKIKKNAQGAVQCGPYGIDDISFQFSANAGAKSVALKQAASGGELSRIMLAIKSVFAHEDSIATLVFDEVDAGIGGEVALQVAKHIKELASARQVLCITHLASLATYAERHYKIAKIVDDKRTMITAQIVEQEERVTEVARMLSGDSEENVSRDHARALLEKVRQ